MGAVAVVAIVVPDVGPNEPVVGPEVEADVGCVDVEGVLEASGLMPLFGVN